MKTAIYIENGVTQLLLTPENDWEKSTLKNITDRQVGFHIRRGQFYECAGGYVRQGTQEEPLILTTIEPETVG